MMNGVKVFLVALSVCAFYFPGHAQMANLSAPVSDSAKHADTVKKLTPRVVYTKPKPVKIKPIRRELSFGLRLNTDGYSFFVDRGKIKAEDEKKSDMFYDIKLLQFEIAEKKDPKESKGSNQQAGSTAEKANPYIYGKINNFYTVKVGRGFRKLIAGKPDPGAVSIHWVGVGGISLGLLKPYYLNAYYNGSVQSIKYTDQTAAAFLDATGITGSSGFSKGLGEMQVIPGLHLKTGLHFDFSGNRKTVLAVETGMNVEAYTQSIKLMAYQDASPILFNLYVSFQFGKRW